MLKFAHKHSIYNHEEIKRSCKAGCFHCTKVFLAKSIKDWTDDDRTALCPKCGTDSMIGDASGFELTRAFLKDMHIAYFSPAGDLFEFLHELIQGTGSREQL